ncbi:hypothetical protein SISNIDRAFT_406878 [Sistotremastrum niveocremeum HHB9708]|uniref:Fe2OG dioxygenase domain-containing protein n=1 Tax=Sistotremastrum niveocremeum HHB9708 TaxID=1314777 RepID=A0A164YB71_9AGAM|nr:hypothetical protein SISNIDRAFT_406878 [Sistotremastrum niveocremeum HHB9708]
MDGQAHRGDDAEFQQYVTNFLAIKNRPFVLSGRMPIDMEDLTLFFRTTASISHALTFPIDVDQNTPPALDVLVATGASIHSSISTDEPMIFPPNLAYSSTLDLTNHPVLETLRNVLFPHIPSGHYLIAQRSHLEIVVQGTRPGPLNSSRWDDGSKVATLILTLPVRFRGGSLVVRPPEQLTTEAPLSEEHFRGRGGKAVGGEIEWTAFLADCEHSVEPIEKGCRLMLSYDVLLRSFGPCGIAPKPIIVPNDGLLDAITPVLHRSRGRRIAFFLTGTYDQICPADVVADSIVPLLKGSDAILFHAVKLYGLQAELRYAAGGYIWTAQQTVQLSNSPQAQSSYPGGPLPLSPASSSGSSGRHRDSHYAPPRRSMTPSRRAGSSGSDEDRHYYEDSGAITLREADVEVLTPPRAPRGVSGRRPAVGVTGPVTRLPVPFVSGGQLNRLFVNVLLVVYA